MGNITSDLGIWTPDSADLGKPDVYLSTMAQSLEDGAGARLRKLESFVGINVSLPSGLTVPVTSTPVTAGLTLNMPYNFNDGMTLNVDGSVTVITAGIYQININANFLPSTTTPARIVTYLYKGSTSIGFSATYGENNSLRYSNCNIVGVYKLAVGDTISCRALCGDATSVMQPGGGTTMSMALTARS